MPPYIPAQFCRSLGGTLSFFEAEDLVSAPGARPCTTAHPRSAFWLNDSDDFYMYDYKIRRCTRSKSHDWTSCPFAHRGEKARRRDPRKIHYSGEPCPEFRKGGSCRRGDACMYAHGVFECWLHPARYRTQTCKAGKDCRRRVCFFAHSMQQLRHVGSPVEESIEEKSSITDLHAHEAYVYERLESGSLMVGMGSLEDLSRKRRLRVDPYERYEMGMAPLTTSSALSSPDACDIAHMGSVSETITMSAQSSPVQDQFSCQRAAARQAVLMHEGSGGGGESYLNVSAHDVSNMAHFRGCGGPARGCMDALRRVELNPDEVLNELSQMPNLICSNEQLLEKNLSSYGLSSPTSPFHISSFLSPPLSPLSTPRSETGNIFSLSRHGNAVWVDGKIPKEDSRIPSEHCAKDSKSKHLSTDQEFVHANYNSQVAGYGGLIQCLGLPSAFFMSGQNKWKHLCNNWIVEETYKHCAMPDHVRQEISDNLGEEGPVQNAMPDLGWVCELVM